MYDGELMFSNRQAVAATAVSTNVLDVERDIGAGTPLYLDVDSPPASGTGTLTVEVQHADNEAMTGATVHVSYRVPGANIPKGGAILCAALPPGNKKFLRLNYNIGGTVTGLVLSAGVTTSRQTA